MPRVNKLVRAGLVFAASVLAAALSATAVPAHAARGPEVGTLQVTWVQQGSWPAPASANTVSGQVIASVDCSGVYTNGGKSFVTGPECLDPESWRVKDRLNAAFGHMLDTWGSRDGEYGTYNKVGRQLAFKGRKLSAPVILMDGEGMMVTRMGALQQNVDGGVRQVFPKPGSKASLKQARTAGVVVFALNQPNPAQSVAFTSDNLAAGDTATVVWFDDTDVDRGAGEVPQKRTTTVRLDTKSSAGNGVNYWWYRGKSGPSLMPSAVGAPVFVDGKLAGIMAVNSDDTPEVLYIMDTPDLRKVLKKYDALETAPDEEPTQAPSPSETATASPSPEATATESETTQPSEESSPTAVEPGEDPVPSASDSPASAEQEGNPPHLFGWSWQLVLGAMAILVALTGVVLSFVLVPRKRAAKTLGPDGVETDSDLDADEDARDSYNDEER